MFIILVSGEDAEMVEVYAEYEKNNSSSAINQDYVHILFCLLSLFF